MDAHFEGKYLEIVNSIVISHSNLTAEEKIKRLLWTGAIINITIWWVYNGDNISAKDMSFWCYNFLEKHDKNSLF